MKNPKYHYGLERKVVTPYMVGQENELDDVWLTRTLDIESPGGFCP